MASLKKNVKKNGEVVYRIQITIYNKVTHKGNAKVITFKPNQSLTPKQQEREAQKFAMEWEDKLKRGESYEGEEMSFADFAEKWLQSRKEDLAYSTYVAYEHIVNNKIVPALGHYKVARIKPPMIEEFYKTLLGSHANGTIQKVKNVLSGMFRTAIRWQMIEVNPCRDALVVKNKEEETTLKYFTPEQSLMFLRSLDMEFETVIRGHERIDDTGKPYTVPDYTESRKLPLQLKVFYTISLYCGLRKGETLALHWTDIDFENHTIRISKSAGKGEEGTVIKKPKTATSIRTVPYPENLTPLLKQYRNEYNRYKFSLGTAWQGDGNLFIQDDGKLMGRSTSYQAYKRHIRRYNEWVRENPEEAKKGDYEVLPDIPLHGLRHSCATLLNYLEINIVDISKILGHAKSSTTMDIYAHSFEGQSKEAASKLNDFIENNKRKQA